MENKNLTEVEWLFEELNIWQTIADEDTNATLDTVRKLLEQAKQMEKEQKEISDEEIEKLADEFALKYYTLGVTEDEVSAFVTGMKWYREQLKKKQ